MSNTGIKMLPKKSSKRKKKGVDADEELELKRLEELLLGGGKTVLENAPEYDEGAVRKDIIEVHKPAWEDPDDSNYNVMEALEAQGRPKMGVPGKPTDDYQLVLKRRFESRVGNPKWARLDRKVENDNDDLLKRCGNFIETDIKTLTKGTMNIKKLTDLNKAKGNEGPYINSVQFHPTSTVALVAGSSCTASIYQVDGSTNPHLQSVRFERFPIRCARFSQDGNQFIVGSQRGSHYFVYDMIEGKTIRVPTHHATEQTNMKRFEVSPDGKLIAVCGKFGNIHLLHAGTKEWIGSLKMNGEVTAICFNPNGTQLWAHSDGGEVSVWDMGERRCVHRWTDEGCLAGTSLHVSHQLVACGSSTGVVNVYQAVDALLSAAPLPTKTLLHLVTTASAVQFNPTGQILAMASDTKDGAFKLVHFPSGTVFSNFPAKDTLLGRVHSHAFSPRSGFLAIGNSANTVKLFRLKHFGNY